MYAIILFKAYFMYLLKIGFPRLRERQLVSDTAGEVWYACSILAALLLFGLAVFFFIFGALPYWFKLHKSLHEILGCEFYVTYFAS